MAIYDWNRLKQSFIYAWTGIWTVLKKEQNFWIMVLFSILVIFLMFYLNLTRVEKSLHLVALAGVLTAEIANTAIELVMDKFDLSDHGHVKIVKDIMAGTVLIWSIVTLAVAIIIFWPYFM